MQAKKKKPKNRDAEVCLQQISVSCPINNMAFARQLLDRPILIATKAMLFMGQDTRTFT